MPNQMWYYSGAAAVVSFNFWDKFVRPRMWDTWDEYPAFDVLNFFSRADQSRNTGFPDGFVIEPSRTVYSSPLMLPAQNPSPDPLLQNVLFTALAAMISLTTIAVYFAHVSRALDFYGDLQGKLQEVVDEVGSVSTVIQKGGQDATDLIRRVKHLEQENTRLKQAQANTEKAGQGVSGMATEFEPSKNGPRLSQANVQYQQAELDQLKSTAESTRHRIEKLEAEIKSLQATRLENQKTIEDYEELRGNIEKDLDAAESENARLMKETKESAEETEKLVTSYKREIANLKEAALQARNQVRDLSADVGKANSDQIAHDSNQQAKIEGLSNEKKRLEEANAKLVQDVSEKQFEIVKLTGSLSGLEKEKADLTGANRRQQSQIIDLSDAKSDLDTKNENLNQSNSKSQNQISELSNEKSNLETEKGELVKQASESMSGLKEKNRILEQSVLESKDEAKILESAKTGLIERVKSLRGDISLKDAKINSLEMAIKEASSNLTKAEDENKRLAGVNSKNAAEFQTLNKEKISFESTQSSLQTTVDQKDSTITSLEDAISNKSSENTRLLSDFEKLSKNDKTLNDEIERIKKQKDELQLSVDSLRVDVKKQRSENEDLRAGKAKEASEFATLQEMYDRSVAEQQKTAVDRDYLKQKLSTVPTQELITKKDLEIRFLESELESKASKILELEEYLEKNDSETESMVSSMSATEAMFQDAKVTEGHAWTRLERNRDKLNKRIERLSEKLSKSEQQNKDLQKRLNLLAHGSSQVEAASDEPKALQLQGQFVEPPDPDPSSPPPDAIQSLLKPLRVQMVLPARSSSINKKSISQAAQNPSQANISSQTAHDRDGTNLIASTDTPQVIHPAPNLAGFEHPIPPPISATTQPSIPDSKNDEIIALNAPEAGDSSHATEELDRERLVYDDAMSLNVYLPATSATYQAPTVSPASSDMRYVVPPRLGSPSAMSEHQYAVSAPSIPDPSLSSSQWADESSPTITLKPSGTMWGTHLRQGSALDKKVELQHILTESLLSDPATPNQQHAVSALPIFDPSLSSSRWANDSPPTATLTPSDMLLGALRERDDAPDEEVEPPHTPTESSSSDPTERIIHGILDKVTGSANLSQSKWSTVPLGPRRPNEKTWQYHLHMEKEDAETAASAELAAQPSKSYSAPQDRSQIPVASTRNQPKDPKPQKKSRFQPTLYLENLKAEEAATAALAAQRGTPTSDLANTTSAAEPSVLTAPSAVNQITPPRPMPVSTQRTVLPQPPAAVQANTTVGPQYSGGYSAGGNHPRNDFNSSRGGFDSSSRGTQSQRGGSSNDSSSRGRQNYQGGRNNNGSGTNRSLQSGGNNYNSRDSRHHQRGGNSNNARGQPQQRGRGNNN